MGIQTRLRDNPLKTLRIPETEPVIELEVGISTSYGIPPKVRQQRQSLPPITTFNIRNTLRLQCHNSFFLLGLNSFLYDWRMDHLYALKLMVWILGFPASQDGLPEAADLCLLSCKRNNRPLFLCATLTQKTVCVCSEHHCSVFL